MRLALLVALALLSALPARAEGAEEGAGTPPTAEEAVAAALASFAQSGCACTAPELERTLLALGPDAIAPLSLALASAQTLPPESEPAVLGALASQPPEPLRAYLKELAASAAAEELRCTGLRVLARVAQPADLELCVSCASPAEEEAAVPRARRIAFEQALLAVVRRAPEGRYVLADLLPSLDGSLVGPAVRALALERTPETLELFSGLLGRVEGADGLLLAELADVGRSLGRPADERVSVPVRALLAAGDRHVAVLAAQAAAALQDTRAIGDLIALLSHAEPAVRAAAEEALVLLARKHYRGGPEAWERWYRDELDWWVAEAPRVMARLSADDPALAVAAVRELAQHRLNRDESAEAVAAILWRPEQDLVVVACSTLGYYGSPRALPGLLQALERHEKQVVDAAATALRAITGLDLPPDPDAWRAALDPETLSEAR